MEVEDPNKEKITCSFHGDQLGLGYRVTAPVLNPGGVGDGHKEVPGGGGVNGSSNLAMNEADVSLSGNSLPPQKTQRTGLADVSNEVLRKGRPEEVANLIAARPELMNKLEESRPLLAQEVAAGMKGGSRVPGAIGGSALDSSFANGIGQGPGTVAALGRGVGAAKGGPMAGAGAAAATSGGATGGGMAGGEEGEGGGGDFSVGGNVNRATGGNVFSELPASAVTAQKNQKPRIVRADTGREVASVEQADLGLGGYGLPDRVKMKTAKARMEARDSKLWLILLLLALILMVMLGVSRATRSKKKGSPS
jgi:hypothetical protein